MNFTRLCSFAALLLLFGCLNLQPKPLSETGFLPSREADRNSSGSFSFNYLQAGSGPVQCTLEVGNQTITIRMLNGNVRSDSRDSNASYTTIIKGGEYYVSGGNIPGGNCTWYHFSRSQFENKTWNGSFQNASVAEQLPKMPDCKEGNFTEEIFEVEGSVCEFGSLFNFTNS